MKFWSVANLGNIAQWVGAIGTIAAVVIALFKERIISFFKGPVLEVSDITPHCLLLPVNLRDGSRTQGHYYRLWVENNGKTAANEVQVFVSRLERRIADGSFERAPAFLPTNLLWAYDGEPYARRILPEMGKHCDIGHVVGPSQRVAANEDLPNLPPGQSVLSLALEVKALHRPDLLSPGTYRLHLQIAAENCRPIKRTLEITHTGNWFADLKKMLSDGTSMRLLPGP